MALLHETRERHFVADVDVEAIARALLGDLLTYAVQALLFVGEQAQPPSLDRADALVEVIMRVLRP